MVFSSISFIFWLLPLSLIAYFCAIAPWLEKKGGGTFELSSRVGTWLGNAALLLASLVFYFWGEQQRIYILFAVIGLNYVAGLLIGEDATEMPPRRKRYRAVILYACIAGNLAMLVYFKYMNFLVDAFAHAGVHLAVGEVLLPLGISFFVFQAMSYTVDVYRGHARPARDLVSFACYITMFPQLVAGPIVRYVDVASQLRSRDLGFGMMASGVRRFVIGLAKKVLIANQMAIVADKAYAVPSDEVTFGVAWIGTIAYTLQIFFDFSGYSDMAIGLGRMFGFHFLENFNYPYIARSVQDFWRRWHISLSTWFRDYLYIPLGGSRVSRSRTYLNLCLVFALCGFWHGASLNFLFWGLYHGFFLVIERVLQGRGTANRLAGHVYTLTVVMFGWVLFRAEDAGQAMIFWKAMVGMGAAIPGGSEIWLWFGHDIRLAMAAGILCSMPVVPVAMRCFGEGREVGGILLMVRWVLVVALFLACVPLLVAETYNPFIYFRF